MKRTLLVFLILSICSTIYCQNKRYTDSLHVYFKQGSSVIDKKNNEELLNFGIKFDTKQKDTKYKLLSITIQASSSPEGAYRINKILPSKRAESVKKYLIDVLNVDLPLDLIQTTLRAPDWERPLQYALENNIPYKQEAINIIKNTPIVETKGGRIVESRKIALKNLGAGTVWDFMLVAVFPKVRDVIMYVDYEYSEPYLKKIKEQEAKEQVIESKADPVVVTEPDSALEVEVKEVKEVEIDPTVNVIPEKNKKPYYIGLKTNLLYDLALVPNLGAEIYLGKNISTVFNWSYSWWYTDVYHYYWQTYGGDMELRYWFGKAAAQKPLTGFHVGAYAQMRTYDIEFGYKGWQGAKWHFGGGLSFGYALPIAKRLNLDFNIGVGYFGGTYKEYIPRPTYYLWQATKSLKYFGPTKAEISLIWLIGRGNVNRK